MWCPSLTLLSTIVGGLNVIISSLATISCIVLLSVYDQNKFQKANFDDKSNLGLITLIMLLIFSLIWLLFSILLIIGIYKRRHRLMGFWIYFNMICMALLILDAIVELIKELAEGLPATQVFFDFLLTCLGLGLFALCFYPVYRLFRHFRLSPKRERDSSTEIADDKL